MVKFVKYDDAAWHYGGNFPKDQPNRYGGVHIGIFLRWCLLRGWAGADHAKEWPEDVEKVVSGEWTGTEFLFKNCDGKFITDDLTDDGNRFALAYYKGQTEPENLSYTSDYGEAVDDNLYHQPETGIDRDLVDRVIAHRFANFERCGDPFQDANGDLELPRQVLTALKRG